MVSNFNLLKNKTVLITGCGRGIGLSILELFAANGANVFANGKTPGSLEAISGRLEKKFGVKIYPMYFDVSDYMAVQNAFKQIIKIVPTLDIVVNNAGIMEDAYLPMIEPRTVRRLFEVNVFGTIYVLQFSSRVMMRKRSGSIINLSSIVGVNGNAGQVVYSGTKSAVIGVTKSAAKELAPYNIRVNAVAPGFIDTNMIKSVPKDKYEDRLASIKMGRIGTAEDVSRSVLFLASDLSSYVTGQIIGVDGGMLI